MLTLPQTTQDVPMIKKDIEEEIEKCIFRLNLETLKPFISIIEETARETIIKEEIFDHCNNKLINLQENYKNNITEQQQQQIDELQNTINYFYHNPKEVINTIVDYSSQLDKLKKDNLKRKEKIFLITKELELEKGSLAKSKTILLEEFYKEYINQTNDKILILTEQLSENENLTENNNQLLQKSIDKMKEYKGNVSQIKEYLNKLNQESLELELEKNIAKEENKQENIKLIEEKILKNSNQFKSKEKLMFNLYNSIHNINTTIEDTQDILYTLEDEKNSITKNITNKRQKLYDIKQKLNSEKDRQKRLKTYETLYYDSLEDYIGFIDKGICQNQKLLQINIIKIEKIKSMNFTDIYKYKDVKKTLSNDSLMTTPLDLASESDQQFWSLTPSNDSLMTTPVDLASASDQQFWLLTPFNDSLMTMPLDSDAPSVQQLLSSMTAPSISSTRGESEYTFNFNMDNAGDFNNSLKEILKVGESLEIQQKKKEFIQKELYKCIFYFKSETLVSFLSLTEESKINQKLKEEIFDHCNNKLINLQEKYKQYITEVQQQHINYLQQKIEEFNKNPQLIIDKIKNHITKVNELEQQQEQIKIEIAISKHELNQEKKLLKQEEEKRALNKEVNTPDKITSCQEYYTYLENQKQHEKGTSDPSIKNTNNKLNTIEQKLELQIEKDNKLNQLETRSITRQDYIKLLQEKINKKNKKLKSIKVTTKKIKDKNLHILVEEMVIKERVFSILQSSSGTPNTSTATNAPNTSTATNAPNTSTTTNTPTEISDLEIGTKRKSTSKKKDHPAKRRAVPSL